MSICSPCLTNFLDYTTVNGAIRDAIAQSMSFAADFDTSGMQAQMDQFSAQLAVVSEEVTAAIDQIDAGDNALAEINQAILDSGINPGDCPELDTMIAMLGSLNVGIEVYLKNPVLKVNNTIAKGLASLNTSITLFNGLKAQAEAFKLC